MQNNNGNKRPPVGRAPAAMPRVANQRTAAKTTHSTHAPRSVAMPAALATAGAALAVVLAALASHMLSSGAANTGSTAASALQPVAMQDLAAALETIDPQQREEIAAKAKSCEQPLVKMTMQGIASGTTPPSGIIQIKTANYLSPPLVVSDKAVSFAIPYVPANVPGRDQIEIIGQATAVRVSLNPPRFYPLVSGAVLQPVWWEPASCQPVGK